MALPSGARAVRSLCDIALDVLQLLSPAFSFMRNASRRRSLGILSKPDSVTISNAPFALFSSLNSPA